MLEDEKSQRLLGQMQSDIRHLQSDVTDIKVEQRIRFDRIDARFDKVDARFKDHFDKVDARFDKADDRFRSIEKEMGGSKESLASAKVWALGLYVALAGGMLYVMARGFKWL